jgi:hypothetical protein
MSAAARSFIRAPGADPNSGWELGASKGGERMAALLCFDEMQVSGVSYHGVKQHQQQRKGWGQAVKWQTVAGYLGFWVTWDKLHFCPGQSPTLPCPQSEGGGSSKGGERMAALLCCDEMQVRAVLPEHGVKQHSK